MVSMGQWRSKSGHQVTSYENLVYTLDSRDHNSIPILMKLKQNVCLDNLLVKFDYGSCMVILFTLWRPGFYSSLPETQNECLESSGTDAGFIGLSWLLVCFNKLNYPVKCTKVSYLFIDTYPL